MHPRTLIAAATLALLAPAGIQAQRSDPPRPEPLLSDSARAAPHAPIALPSADPAYAFSRWQDRSPHYEREVAVEPGVRLQVLDWGGTGPALVFLPGTGLSAHIFDLLAPHFTGAYHVLAITPRGQGASDTPLAGYTVEREAADLGAVLDSLGIRQATLAGHSLAGAVITRFAREHRARVDRLIYLDAAIDYDGIAALDRANPVRRPAPPAGSIEDYRDWLARYFYGGWNDALQAELVGEASRPDENADRRDALMAALDRDATANPKDYAGITAPVLVVWSQKTVAAMYPWLTAADHAARDRAATYLRDVRAPWERRGLDRLRAALPHAEVVTMPGGHYFFALQPERTARLLRSFLGQAAGRRN